MDSSTESSSFLSHLNSQEPYSQHPNEYVSKQCTDDLNLDSHTVDDRKERRKWSPTEDVVLISAWLNTSKDPVVTKDNGRSRRRKCDDQSAQSSTSVPGSHGEDEVMARPLGVKAARAKAKRSVSRPVEEESKAVLDFQRMWEIKQKDFALRDKLSKKNLLLRLLTKTEPLSEMEMALKNKLINVMLAS